MNEEMKLINMADVNRQEVEWLWYPYIPIGKLTILQGDPGEGKTMLVLAITAMLTNGEPLPQQKEGLPPVTVIYQTAEDGLADTVKPRLEKAGADCKRVVVIDDIDSPLSISDERLEQAILSEKAKLLILDPMQAYLGADVDMHRANEVRPAFRKLASVAERTNCAVLGSIDINAAARSILLVGRDKDNKNIRIMEHLKSSLAPEGQSVAFELDEVSGFSWIGHYEVSAEELLNGKPKEIQTKQSQAEQLLIELLKQPMKSTDVYERLSEYGIGKRTADNAKQSIGVKSYRKGNGWYLTLKDCKDATLQ